MKEWMSDLKERFRVEWKQLEDCIGALEKELALAVHLKVARDAMHAHEGDDVTHKGEALEDNNNVTSGPTTRTETAAMPEHKPESGDGSPDVQIKTESMKIVMEFLQVQTQAITAQALAGAVQHLLPLLGMLVK